MADPHRTFNASLKLVGAVSVAGALAAGVALPFVGGAGVMASTVADGFNNQQCTLDLASQPAQRTVITASNGQPITYLYQQNRDIASAKEIPPVVRQAIVSIEDRRFYQHHGVDVQGLLRATVRTTSGDTQGASTLTQQLVKQLNLYGASSADARKAAVEQTAGRKLKEARCALEMEKTYSKDQILTNYLNIANFGAGAYGVKLAAKSYFPKTRLPELSVSQAALIAGMVQSPSRYNPYRHPQAAKARRHEVLAAMLRDGKITVAQATEADQEPVPAGTPPASQALGCANASGGASYNIGFFCDYVIEYAKDQLGLSEEQLYSGGYRITTTLNPVMQLTAQNSVYSHMTQDGVRAQHATAVLPIVENATGYVRAMAVSKTYGTKPGQTVDPLPYRAMGEGAGSTYKVFTLLAALKRKVPLRVYSITTPNNEYTPTNCQTRGTIHNAGHYPDTNNLEFATYASANTFFEALIDQQFHCDLSEIYQTAVDLGLKTLDTPAIRHKVVDGQQISFTLGPDSTNPLEMAGAFGTLANEGKHCDPTPILKIVDNAGKNVRIPGPQCKQVIDPAIAHTATQVLEKDTDPGVSGNTAKRAHIPGYATAGKTGTTQNNAAVWFIGFTPQLSGAVAVFDPKAPSSPLTDVPGYSGRAGDVFGGGVAAPIWHDAFAPIMQAYPQTPWPAEDPDVVRGNAVPVPSVIGMDLQQATATLAAQGFGIKVVGTQDSPVPKDQVASQSPSNYAMPGDTIQVMLSTGKGGPLPPECLILPSLPQCTQVGTGGGGRGRPGGGGLIGPTPTPTPTPAPSPTP
ncbi:MAG: transglycosylase domain-containing protein [Actinobacteria bacterium]|nr:transglycosylase domain-containing protein [Actinomycetota bacterium]MBI3686393.1 transglycosylase domain-containing protein [Actinomycetota bacterium]